MAAACERVGEAQDTPRHIVSSNVGRILVYQSVTNQMLFLGASSDEHWQGATWSWAYAADRLTLLLPIKEGNKASEKADRRLL